MEKYVGWLFIAIGLAGIFVNVHLGTAPYILWFCNHTAIVLGIAFLFRSPYWITAEVSVGLIPQLLWGIDYLSKLFFGTHWLGGFTSYMFSPEYHYLHYYMSLNHLVLTPLALYGLYTWGVQKDAWQGALLHGLVLLPFSYLLPEYNLNCMNRTCMPLLEGWVQYPYFAPFILAATILLTYYVLIMVFKTSKRS